MDLVNTTINTSNATLEVLATTPVETTMTESQMVTATLAFVGLYIVFRWAMKK